VAPAAGLGQGWRIGADRCGGAGRRGAGRIPRRADTSGSTGRGLVAVSVEGCSGPSGGGLASGGGSARAVTTWSKKIELSHDCWQRGERNRVPGTYLLNSSGTFVV
jgi:hypothetical protein